MASTIFAASLQPQLQPHPISEDASPLGFVVVWVSTVTAPVTTLLVVVGAAVLVRLVHSLQKSQELTMPSFVTAVAHQDVPSKLTQLVCSFTDDEEPPWKYPYNQRRRNFTLKYENINWLLHLSMFVPNSFPISSYFLLHQWLWHTKACHLLHGMWCRHHRCFLCKQTEKYTFDTWL